MVTAIRCGRLIDGMGADAIVDGMVLVDGERIAVVGPANRVEVPESVQTVDLGDLTVMPGLIDMHAHLGFVWGEGSSRAQMLQPMDKLIIGGVVNCRRYLKQGVTTIRELGNKHFADQTVKEAVEKGLIPGPRIWAATRGLRTDHGHGNVATPVNGADNIRAALRENMAKGADFLKIFVSGGILEPHTIVTNCYYTREEIAAAIDEAHRAGKKIAAHCEGGPGVRHCLELGMDTLEHVPLVTDEDVELWLKVGSASTAVITMGYIFQLQTDELTPRQRELQVMAKEVAPAGFQKVRQAGIKWVCGTDNANISLDLELLVRFGATNMEALQAVGKRAAETIGIADKVGTLEKGKYADLIAVDGDPLADIGAMTRVVKVMRGGRMFDTASL